MKKRKLMSAILVVSMLMPLAGCYSDNKGVTEAVDKYVNAIKSLDGDDVADLMDDDDGVDDVFAPYETACNRNKKFETVFEVIADSITYEIDKKSIKSSTKDKTASCDITITMVDYEEIFDEVSDDDGDIDDYIDALEDADEDQIIEIEVTMEFVYQRDKWLVKDKKVKNLNKICKFFTEVSTYSLLGVPAISESAFRDALYDVFDLDDYDLYEWNWSNYEELEAYYKDCCIEYRTYSSTSGAQDDFDYYLSDVESFLSSDDLKNRYVSEYDGVKGYMLFNEVDYFGWDFYGGYYLYDNVMVIVYCIDGDSSQYNMVDEFLEELGCPTPR